MFYPDQMKKHLILICLLAAGCVTNPDAYVYKPMADQPTALEQAKLICHGKASEAFAAARSPAAGHDAQTAIYKGCMAEHGWSAN